MIVTCVLFDAEEYAEHEKEVIEDLDYCLAAP